MNLNEKRTIAERIFKLTLGGIEVEAVVREALRLQDDRLLVGDEDLDLRDYGRILVIALGKAAVGMARAAEGILGDRVTAGVVVSNALSGEAPYRLPVMLGGHPTPNQASLDAAAFALNLLRRHDSPETLVLFLISGGGSAVFEQPADPAMTLDDLQSVNRTLVNCGAVINEMNIVRRRLSAVKGGKLAQAAPASRQISLYISDVNSDDLATVASGPTLPDPATDEDLARIVERYDLLAKFPPRVAEWLAKPPARHEEAASSPRSHHLLLDNRRALEMARRIAEEGFGLVVEVADDLVEGEVQEMAEVHLRRLLELSASHPGRSVCLLSGGEVICPVRGTGQGGRNQEFVLRLAFEMERQGVAGVTALSAGTDGIDGNSPAAGALADETTIPRARAAGLSPESHLDQSDSYNLFRSLGDAIITGPTGNNVRDLRILVLNRAAL